jgi:hypothetical protein
MIANMRHAPTERSLVDFVLRTAERHKGKEIRDAIPGVTEHDVSRWKRHPNATLTGEKKRAIMDAMDRVGFGASGAGRDDTAPYMTEALETDSMWDRLAIIETIPDPLVQLLRVEALAAVIRAEALRLACAAAGREVGVAESRTLRLADVSGR